MIKTIKRINKIWCFVWQYWILPRYSLYLEFTRSRLRVNKSRDKFLCPQITYYQVLLSKNKKGDFMPRGRKKVTLIVPLRYQSKHPLNYREPFKLIHIQWSWYRANFIERRDSLEYYQLLHQLGISATFFAEVTIQRRGRFHRTWVSRDIIHPLPGLQCP